MGRFADAADEALRGLDAFEHDRFQRGLYLCLLGNAAEALFWQGRWDELAARLHGLDRPDDTKTMHLNLWLVAAAHLTATGDFAEAQSTVDACRYGLAGAHLELTGHLHACVAELRLWQGDPGAAWASVQQALDILGENCSHGPLVARLLADGARARADLAILHRTEDGEALDRLAERIALLPNALRLTSLAQAHLSQAQAELARLEPDAIGPWESCAKRWDDLGAAYPTAYANWRHAEALLSCGARRQVAEGPLAEAHAAAQRLGAQPLCREIAAIAARARLNLGAQPAAKAQTPFGLTARELDVLALLARGQTNRQIANGLFISEKTASIHVSRILTKLGVPNRGAAAATAHRLGLAQVSPTGG
jgi:DNA-binding CsgD family transcriptional regulator